VAASYCTVHNTLRPVPDVAMELTWPGCWIWHAAFGTRPP